MVHWPGEKARLFDISQEHLNACLWTETQSLTHITRKKIKKQLVEVLIFFIVTTNWSPWSKKKRFICIPVNFSPFFSQFDRVLCILADLCVFLFIYRARVYLDLKGEITLRDPWNTLVNGIWQFGQYASSLNLLYTNSVCIEGSEIELLFEKKRLENWKTVLIKAFIFHLAQLQH